MCNILNCGSINSIKNFYDQTTQEVIAFDEDEDLEMKNYREEGSSKIVNCMMKGLIRGLKTSHDKHLVTNILEAFGKLFEVNKIYYDSYYEIDSILAQFIELEGMAALDICMARFSAHDLTN